MPGTIVVTCLFQGHIKTWNHLVRTWSLQGMNSYYVERGLIIFYHFPYITWLMPNWIFLVKAGNNSKAISVYRQITIENALCTQNKFHPLKYILVRSQENWVKCFQEYLPLLLTLIQSWAASGQMFDFYDLRYNILESEVSGFVFGFLSGQGQGQRSRPWPHGQGQRSQPWPQSQGQRSRPWPKVKVMILNS